MCNHGVHVHTIREEAGGRGDHRAAARAFRRQLGRLEEEIRRERKRRASSAGGGADAPCIQEGTAPPVPEVLEYRPHEDGYLQLELRRYIRRDGSARERGPYWYFQYHEGGKRKKLYLGKTTDPEDTLAAKRANPLRE